MNRWFRGKSGGFIAFVVIAALVVGGLGWVTAAALRLEEEQRAVRAQEEQHAQLRIALWRLDSRIWPVLAKEDSRPYNEYNAVYTPPLALRNDGSVCQPATLVIPSPLLNAELPDWMLLHFRIEEDGKKIAWGSPQVLSATLKERLTAPQVNTPLGNVTPQRQQLLDQLVRHLPPDLLLGQVQQRSAELTLIDTTVVPNPNYTDTQQQPLQLVQQAINSGNNAKTQNRGFTQNNFQGQQIAEQQRNESEYNSRAIVRSVSQKEVQNKSQMDHWSVAAANSIRNGEVLFSRRPPGAPPGKQTLLVNMGALVPLWLPVAGEEQLIVARLVQIGDKQLCQGIVLDWRRLQAMLAEEVSDLFPEAAFVPMRDDSPPFPERTMTALPIQLNPGPETVTAGPAGWTPLRVGLSLAWAAALVALLAVGLGGWALIDLSQRRIRFVSAVTHELRTPLTTLRLYLDMLTGGLVQDEAQRAEYLQTLNTESERLNRLVGNVLAFSRLENQRPRLNRTQTVLEELLDQVHTTWAARCQHAGKELVIESAIDGATVLFTDQQLVQQVLGNLIENACKYSQGAEDRRIWLRARSLSSQRLVLEVEDRGPGVPPSERRSIFRPFCRGRSADVTAGGVGLGLALAQRWASLLGGTLTVGTGAERVGACFRLELPLQLS